MTAYNYQRLSPYDFEELMHDLLEKKLNIPLEAFSKGADGGIDLRCCKPKKSSAVPLIIQCKHCKDWKILQQELKKEIPKVAALKPGRYIVATSLPLSPARKNEIQTLFAPWIRNPADILGEADIDHGLRTNRTVLDRHFKLWLSDVTILKRVVHSDIENVSTFRREEIQRDIKLFVRNQSFSEAQKLLKKNHYCIISGKPGIGKTTLAYMLLYHYMHRGYGVVFISNTMSEGWKMLESEGKQVFYFDDFLGKNFLRTPLERNEDDQIHAFIEKVRRSPNKRLIFSTREYCLSQAKNEHETLSRGLLDVSKCTINLANYTRSQKARILYNHLHHSSIPAAVKRHICESGAYRDLIPHPNYTPRIIESFASIEEKNPEKFIQACHAYLNDPEKVWKHPFDTSITPGAQRLLRILCTLPYFCRVEMLQNAWQEFSKAECRRYGTVHKREDFDRVLQELDGSFINITKTTSDNEPITFHVSFHDPSVIDFLLSGFQKDQHLLHDILESATYWDQAYYCVNVPDTHPDDGMFVMLMERLDLPSINQYADRARRLSTLLLHQSRLPVQREIRKTTEQLAAKGPIDAAFISLLMLAPPETTVDSTRLLTQYLASVDSHTKLEKHMSNLNADDFVAFAREQDVDLTSLDTMANEILDEIQDEAMSVVEYEKGQYKGDRIEFERTLSSAQEIADYFNIGDDIIKNLKKIEDQLMSYEQRDDDDDKDQEERTLTSQEEDRRVENIFGAGL